MEQKLIAIDLDGTLLREDCTISGRNREAVCRAMEAGHIVVPCTGRSYRNALFVLRDFPTFPFYLNANGTTLVRGGTEELLYTGTMPPETGRTICRLSGQYETFIEVYHRLTAYDDASGRRLIEKSLCSEEYRIQLLQTNTHLESLDELVLRPDVRIGKYHIIFAKPDEQKRLRAELEKVPGIAAISTTDFNIEICADGCCKRTGLRKLCGLLGMDARQVIAMGDSENDLEMLQWAGTGIAMANASKKIKDSAGFSTASNEEDGVALALERFL